MNRAPPQFLFDECVGKPAMHDLRRVLKTDAKFVHITEKYGSGAKDNEWIPALAAEGGWVVITSDGGRKSKRGNKLPVICAASKLTHVVLSAKLHERTAHEKSAALAFLWSKIEVLRDEEPGSRFNLRFKSLKGKTGLAVILERCER